MVKSFNNVVAVSCRLVVSLKRPAVKDVCISISLLSFLSRASSKNTVRKNNKTKVKANLEKEDNDSSSSSSSDGPPTYCPPAPPPVTNDAVRSIFDESIPYMDESSPKPPVKNIAKGPSHPQGHQSVITEMKSIFSGSPRLSKSQATSGHPIAHSSPALEPKSPSVKPPVMPKPKYPSNLPSSKLSSSSDQSDKSSISSSPMVEPKMKPTEPEPITKPAEAKPKPDSGSPNKEGPVERLDAGSGRSGSSEEGGGGSARKSSSASSVEEDDIR